MDKAKAILFNTGLKHWNFSQEVLGSISGHCFRDVAIGKAVQSRSLTLPKPQILDSSKVKEFADDNIKLMLMTKFSNPVENIGEKKKLLVMSNFFFSHSGFERLVIQTRKNQGLFGKGLNMNDPKNSGIDEPYNGNHWTTIE